MKPRSLRLGTQGFLLVFVSFMAGCVWPVAGAEVQPTDQPTRPLRVAIPEFVTDAASGLKSKGPVLVDLLTARLSSEAGFALVERAALDKVLRETALSISGQTKPEAAVRVGKVLGADWFLLGSFLSIEGTNLVLAKIVDAQTGILRDLTSLPFAETNVMETADALAAFIVSSRNSVRSLGDRFFVAIGHFEDLGMRDSYPGFSDQLRAAISARFAGSRLWVVERAQVKPLLDELRLSLAGLTEGPTRAPVAQPAFLLVDGLYQFFRDEKSKINLVLRLERLGHGIKAVSVNELPGKALEEKVAEAIDRVSKEALPLAPPPTRQEEVNAQIKRGKQIAQSIRGLPPGEEFRQRRVPQINDAIHAFESALLLDPNCLEAKFNLASCLSDPQIGQREQARDYWREYMAGSTNAEMNKTVRLAIADSYLADDVPRAIDLYLAFKGRATDLEDIGLINNKLSRLYAGAVVSGKMSKQAWLEFSLDSWKTDCRIALARAARGQRIKSDATFERAGDFAPLFKENREAMIPFIQSTYSNMMVEFPKLAPYFISGYVRWAAQQTMIRAKDIFKQMFSGPWRQKYEEILSQCDKSPGGVLSPTNFYSGSLYPALRAFMRVEEYDFADRLSGLLQKHGRKFLDKEEQDQLDLITGSLYFRQEKWGEALAAFDRIGNRNVSATFSGPLSKGECASSAKAVQACRRHLAQTVEGTTRNPPQFEPIRAPAPVKAFPGSQIIFTVDGPRIWVADDTGLYDYNPGAGVARKTPLRVPPPTGNYIGPPLATIATAKGKVWLGTYTSGLIAFDPSTELSTNYTMDAGLLTMTVESLLPFEDQLWIGFSASRGGGLGYLDLTQNRFTGTMPELSADLVLPREARTTRSTSINSSAPPRGQIAGFALAPSGGFWVAVPGGAAYFTGMPSNKWERLTIEPNVYYINIVANDRFLALTRMPAFRWATSIEAGLLIYDLRSKSSRPVSLRDGLPNDSLSSLAVNGDTLWVGGAGFLAAIDLPTGKVKKVCKLRAIFNVDCLELAGNDLWFCAGPGLYRMPKDSN